MTRRETIERERWILAAQGRDAREIAEALLSLPGRRVVVAEAWVERPDVVEAAA